MSVLEARVNTAITSLRKWITDNREQIAQAVSDGIQRADENISRDDSWRVPRDRSLRERRFERWLAPFESVLDASIAESIHNTFSSISVENAAAAAEMAMRHLPESIRTRYEAVIERQRREAVRGIALAWTSRHVSDGLAIGEPVWDGVLWAVPLYARDSGALAAELVLDADGEVRTAPDDLANLLAGAL